jgi:hypothetical protein
MYEISRFRAALTLSTAAQAPDQRQLLSGDSHDDLAALRSLQDAGVDTRTRWSDAMMLASPS